MVKKFCYFLRYYNILFHLLLGIGFCIISSPLSDLLCYLQKIPDERSISTAYLYLPTNTSKGMYLKSEVHAFHYPNKYYFLYTIYIPRN